VLGLRRLLCRSSVVCHICAASACEVERCSVVGLLTY
jgi:hypothetical protein